MQVRSSKKGEVGKVKSFSSSVISKTRPERYKTTTGYGMRFLNSIKSGYLRIESFVYPRLLVPAVALLPAPLAYGVAVLRANIRSRWEKDALKEVERSIELLFGNRFSPEERRHMALDFLRNQSCKTIDAMRLLGNGRALLRLIEVRGLENLKTALDKRKGVILCSAHLGSPTCCFSVVGALGFPVTLIARWSFLQHESRFPRRMIHRLVGNKPVTSHLRRPNIVARSDNIGAAVQAANVLRRNEVLGMMLDASVVPNNPARPIEVDFLNGKASLAPGAVKIAQLTGAPILMMVMHRSRDWRHQVLEISGPIPIDIDTLGSFRRCLSVLEATILQYPAQWSRLRSPSFLQRGFVPKGAIVLPEPLAAPRNV